MIHNTVVQQLVTWPKCNRCFPCLPLQQTPPHLAADGASLHPSGTVTTPRLRAVPTVRREHPPIPWTHMPQGCTQVCLIHMLILTLTLTLTPTLTLQTVGDTHRPRPTGLRGPFMNCTHPRLWSPTTDPCWCPRWGPPTSPRCQATMTWASWSPLPRGPVCFLQETSGRRWHSTWMQVSVQLCQIEMIVYNQIRYENQKIQSRQCISLY